MTRAIQKWSHRSWKPKGTRILKKSYDRAEELFTPSLRLNFHHQGHGSDEFWITMNGETIWQFPGDYYLDPARARWERNYDYYVGEITKVIDEFKNRPRAECALPLTRKKEGLEEILVAADRRVGRQHLTMMLFNTQNDAARRIIADRLARKGPAE